MDPLKQATYGALYVIFDDERWLHFSLESVYGECDVILVLIANAPWNGPPRSTEGTVQSVLNFPDPDKKIHLLRGDWKSETEQRNAGRRRLMEMGIQYCFVIDADEVYDPVQLRRMMVFAPCIPEVDVWHISWVTYWKSRSLSHRPSRRVPAGSPPASWKRAVRRTSERGRNPARLHTAARGDHPSPELRSHRRRNSQKNHIVQSRQ